MNKGFQYSGIVSKIKTKAEADTLKREVELLLESLFKTDRKSLQAVLQTSIRHDIAEAIKLDCRKSGVKIEDREEFKNFLILLKARLEEFKIARLALAFTISEKTINKLSAKAKTSLGQDVILELSVDESLLGGAVISYEGKFLDLSLKNKIEEVFKNRQEEITALIASQGEALRG